MTTTRINPDGSITCLDVVKGQLIKRTFIGYSQKEAYKKFCQVVKHTQGMTDGDIRTANILPPDPIKKPC